MVGTAIEVYPDPASSKLTVAFTLSEKSTINLSVYDVRGVRMYNEQLKDQPAGPQKMELNISSFQEGMYILRVTTDKMAVTKNFIKED